MKNYINLADEALDLMEKHAKEQGIAGVAIVAYVEDQKNTTWTTKMRIVGTHKIEPEPESEWNKNGTNLIAIAYSKAAEMMDTFRNSGSGVRPLMNWECGYSGGVIRRVKSGYALAAFSGGKDAQDVALSELALGVLEI